MMRGLALAAGLAAAAHAAAQTPVIPPAADPGAIQQRQIDEERRRREAERESRKPPAEPLRRAPEKPAPSAGAPGVRFLVREIRFTPSEILTAAELEGLASEYRGRQASLADLQQLANRVNALYRAKGVVTAQAVLPPQDISEGSVLIRLVEGRFGKSHLRGNESTDGGFIDRRLGLAPGDLMDLQRLEGALIRFNRTTDAQLRAELKPGETFGTTDVYVDVAEPPRHDLRLTLDNFGSSATGELRRGVAYLNRSLIGFRDELSLSVTRADGQDSRAASYGFPVTTSGARVHYGYFTDETEIVHGALAPLHITGESRAHVLTFRQPLHVAQATQVDMVAGVKRRESENWIDGVFLQRTDTRDRSLGGEIQWTRGRAYWFGSFTRAWGHAFVTDGTGYRIDRATLRHHYELGSGASFRGAFSWQNARKDLLPSSEQFFIGGDGSVRGYDIGTFAGEAGHFVNLELHKALGATATDRGELAASGFVFLDHGQVTPFRPPNTRLPTHDRLTSIGYGIHTTLERRFYGRVTFAYGLREIPNAPRQYAVHFQLLASVF